MSCSRCSHAPSLIHWSYNFQVIFYDLNGFIAGTILYIYESLVSPYILIACKESDRWCSWAQVGVTWASKWYTTRCRLKYFIPVSPSHSVGHDSTRHSLVCLNRLGTTGVYTNSGRSQHNMNQMRLLPSASCECGDRRCTSDTHRQRWGLFSFSETYIKS